MAIEKTYYKIEDGVISRRGEKQNPSLLFDGLFNTFFDRTPAFPEKGPSLRSVTQITSEVVDAYEARICRLRQIFDIILLKLFGIRSRLEELKEKQKKLLILYSFDKGSIDLIDQQLKAKNIQTSNFIMSHRLNTFSDRINFLVQLHYLFKDSAEKQKSIRPLLLRAAICSLRKGCYGEVGRLLSLIDDSEVDESTKKTNEFLHDILALVQGQLGGLTKLVGIEQKKLYDEYYCGGCFTGYSHSLS